MNPRRPIEEETSASSLSAAVERYMGWQTSGRPRPLTSTKSLRPMEQSLNRWVALVGPQKMTKDLTLPDVEDYLNFLRQPHKFGDGTVRPGVADQTIKSQFAIIRAFLRWLAKRKYVLHPSLFSGETFAMETPEVDNNPKDVYRPEELDLMWAAVDEVDKHNQSRNRAILTVLLGSGIRLSELANLDDRDFEGGMLHIRAPKNHKQRWVPINGLVQDAIREYKARRAKFEPNPNPDGREPLFIGEGGKRLSEIGIQKMIQRLKNWAGGTTMTAGPHKFRHTYATYTVIYERQAKGDANWMELGDRLGHSSVNVTKGHYYHYDPKLKVPERWARYLVLGRA